MFKFIFLLLLIIGTVAIFDSPSRIGSAIRLMADPIGYRNIRAYTRRAQFG